MVGLSEVVLNIIVLCRNAQLDKLILESSTLLKEAMNFSVDFHLIKIKLCYMGRLDLPFKTFLLPQCSDILLGLLAEASWLIETAVLAEASGSILALIDRYFLLRFVDYHLAILSPQRIILHTY